MVRIKDRLSDLGVRPSKDRGQNFLIDQQVIADIVRFGSPAASDHIVEIGPGLGALTGELAAINPALTLIELQEQFCAELAKRFSKAKVVHSDVLAVDFSELGSDLVVFGNLPYSRSTDIVFHLLAFAGSIRRAVIMVQREFGERLVAQPGGRDYGVISVMVQQRCAVRPGLIVPGSAFHPPAGVESIVVELTMLSEPRIAVDDQLWFQRIVRAAFSRRRKMLHNSLCVPNFLSAPVVRRGLELSSIDGNRRAETLSIEEFGRLALGLRSALAESAEG